MKFPARAAVDVDVHNAVRQTRSCERVRQIDAGVRDRGPGDVLGHPAPRELQIGSDVDHADSLPVLDNGMGDLQRLQALIRVPVRLGRLLSRRLERRDIGASQI